MGQTDNGIGRVEADADNVDARMLRGVHETIIFVCANKCEEIHMNEDKRRAVGRI